MKELQILLPVYNERDTLETVLQEWCDELEKLKISYSFIICEDGSTDGTKQLLKKLRTRYSIVMSQKPYRRGYGRAVLDGLQKASAEYVLCVDSDGQCDPKDFRKFWKIREKATVIIGWRKTRQDSLQRKVFSGSFRAVFRSLFPNHIHDPSAPFVLCKPKAILPFSHHLTYLNEGFWWGFVGMCVKHHLTILELPMHHRARLRGDTQVYKLKKIPSIAGRNLLGLMRLRFATL